MRLGELLGGRLLQCGDSPADPGLAASYIDKPLPKGAQLLWCNHARNAGKSWRAYLQLHPRHLPFRRCALEQHPQSFTFHPPDKQKITKTTESFSLLHHRTDGTEEG